MKTIAYGTILAALMAVIPGTAFSASNLKPRNVTTQLTPEDLCTEALDLSCRKIKQAMKPSEKPTSSLFTRFSNLAGRFMGRVDMADGGDFRFRLTLDIKNPPSSTDNHIYWDD